MYHERIVLLALLGTGCQVTNGVLCSYLNDNCGESAGAESGDTGDEPPPPLVLIPCDQIGAAMGLALVPSHNNWQPWGGAGSVGSHPAMEWSLLFPSGWVWDDASPAPVLDEPALLLGRTDPIVGLALQDITLEGQIASWIQVQGATAGTYGGQPATFLTQSDGSAIVFGAYTTPEAWWEFSGSPVVRGWVGAATQYEFGGPAQSNPGQASHEGLAFKAASGRCMLAPVGVDDGQGEGGGDGEPMPDPMPSPCELMRPEDATIVGEIPWVPGAAHPLDVPLPSEVVVFDNGAWLVPEGPGWALGAERIDVSVPFGPEGVADLRRAWMMTDYVSAGGWSLQWRQYTIGEGPGFDVVYPFGSVYETDEWAIVATEDLPPATPEIDQTVGTERWGFALDATTEDDAAAGRGADGSPFADGGVWDSEFYYPMAQGSIGWAPLGGVCLYEFEEPPAEPPPSADGGSGG